MKTIQKNKYGISLIVLVITIIIMIILATAVVITLSNSGIISKANESVEANDLANVQDLATMLWADAYLEGKSTKDDLTKAVEEGLVKSKIDRTKYRLDVTEAGVTVTKAVWTQEGTFVTNGKIVLEVGDYIDYKANVDSYTDTNGWRVLGAENGEILLISSTYVNDSLTLGGDSLEEAQASYAGGALTALQEECNPFGNGHKATGVRSIKREDIDRIAKYDATKFTGAYYVMEFSANPNMSQSDTLAAIGVSDIETMSVMDYGRTVTFSWDGSEKPVYSYKSEDGTVSKKMTKNTHDSFIWYDETSKVWRTSQKSTEATPNSMVEIADGNVKASITNNTAYYLGTELGISTAVYEMLIANAADNLIYWLASPFAYVRPDTAAFGFGRVIAGKVSGGIFVTSYGYDANPSAGVRAVVSLAEDIQLESATDTSWTIKN